MRVVYNSETCRRDYRYIYIYKIAFGWNFEEVTEIQECTERKASQVIKYDQRNRIEFGSYILLYAHDVPKFCFEGAFHSKEQKNVGWNDIS